MWPWNDKRTYVAEKIVNSPVNTPTEVVPQNSRRVALAMFSATGSTFTTVPSLLSSGSGGGFPSASSAIPLGQSILNRLAHGALVTSAWYAQNSASTDAIQVIEVLEE